jgi:7,8-dihydropterin-6-yl-methyl-4-(beta-D-ribofuranosyl)aminobenzene 5'-phosphate synthase
MDLHVLIDNNTLTDRIISGEPGLSFLIFDEEKQILFDLGFSNLFASNALKIGFDVLKSDHIVLSHGHIDHVGGMDFFVKSAIERESLQNANIIAHPNVFCKKLLDYDDKNVNIGSLFSKSRLIDFFDMTLTKDPIWITNKVIFLGEIPRVNNFENILPFSKLCIKGCIEDDYLFDDSALVYIGENGISIISGCAHAGICNTIEYAKKVSGVSKVDAVIGGFHLQSKFLDDKLVKTCRYFDQIRPNKLYPCHCVNLFSKIELSKVCDIEEVGVGLKIELN